mmetsp:Transcript_177/g.536  ORF Transcript_177/g.536 Transcript_177/m.536 type:complete len:466 (-) Transcript_177:56-1453(-)
MARPLPFIAQLAAVLICWHGLHFRWEDATTRTTCETAPERTFSLIRPGWRRSPRRACRRPACAAAPKTDLVSPPGPWALPLLGSMSLIWSLMRGQSLPQVLGRYRAKYGPIFMLKAGPLRQVWIDDPELFRRIYERPECAGRLTPNGDPYGGSLFHTRDLARAAEIRQQQEAWWTGRSSKIDVRAMVEAAMMRVWPSLDAGGSMEWPTELVRSAMYDVIMRTYLGDLDGLMTEVEDLMQAIAKYGPYAVKRIPEKKHAPIIRQLVDTVLARYTARGGDNAELLRPMLANAAIGGAELLPGLLQWIFIIFAQEPALQATAASAAAAGNRDALLGLMYGVLRRAPFGVALGPPRCVLTETVVDGICLPEGAMLFAMHPAIADSALRRSPADSPASGEEFASYAFGVGPRKCIGRELVETVLVGAVGEVLKRYRVTLKGSPGVVHPKMAGMFCIPADPPMMTWEHRED